MAKGDKKKIDKAVESLMKKGINVRPLVEGIKTGGDIAKEHAEECRLDHLLESWGWLMENYGRLRNKMEKAETEGVVSFDERLRLERPINMFIEGKRKEIAKALKTKCGCKSVFW